MVEVIPVKMVAEDERGATHFLIPTEPDNLLLLTGKRVVQVEDIIIKEQQFRKIRSRLLLCREKQP